MTLISIIYVLNLKINPNPYSFSPEECEQVDRNGFGNKDQPGYPLNIPGVLQVMFSFLAIIVKVSCFFPVCISQHEQTSFS